MSTFVLVHGAWHGDDPMATDPGALAAALVRVAGARAA
jgi:hypothetical protein